MARQLYDSMATKRTCKATSVTLNLFKDRDFACEPSEHDVSNSLITATPSTAARRWTGF